MAVTKDFVITGSLTPAAQAFDLAGDRGCMLGKFILGGNYLVFKFRRLLPLHNFAANYILTGAGGDLYLKQTCGADECLVDGSSTSIDCHRS